MGKNSWFYIFVFAHLLFTKPMSAQEKINADLFELCQMALAKNPTVIRGQYSVNNTIADLLIQQSIFNTQFYSDFAFNVTNYNVFAADSRNEYLNGSLVTRFNQVSFGFQKYMRSGQTIDLGIGYSGSSDNLPFNRFNQPENPFQKYHTSSLKLTLNQPLLRGKGRDIATSNEKIQKLIIENTKANNFQNTSTEIWKVVSAYWDYLYAFHSLAIYHKNEQRVNNVLQITGELVEGDKKPKSELVQIHAELANQERLTEVAEQNLFNTKIILGNAIGLSHDESEDLGIPLNEFPTISSSKSKKLLSFDSLVILGIESRGDYEAMISNQEMAEIELKVARNNLKPQLDAFITLDYGGESFGNGVQNGISSLTNQSGRNLGGGLGVKLNLPFKNLSAKGQLAKGIIQQKDMLTIKENLERQIALNIKNAKYNLEQSIQILEKSQQSFHFYQEAFENEKLKFQNGLTTLLNLIIFQERLTYSEIEYLQAKRNFANTILNMRYETGTLISQDKNQNFSLQEKSFYTFPNHHKN